MHVNCMHASVCVCVSSLSLSLYLCVVLDFHHLNSTRSSVVIWTGVLWTGSGWCWHSSGSELWCHFVVCVCVSYWIPIDIFECASWIVFAVCLAGKCILIHCWYFVSSWRDTEIFFLFPKERLYVNRSRIRFFARISQRAETVNSS